MSTTHKCKESEGLATGRVREVGASGLGSGAVMVSTKVLRMWNEIQELGVERLKPQTQASSLLSHSGLGWGQP